MHVVLHVFAEMLANISPPTCGQKGRLSNSVLKPGLCSPAVVCVCSVLPHAPWERAPESSGEWTEGRRAGVRFTVLCIKEQLVKMSCATSIGAHAFMTMYLLFVTGCTTQKVSRDDVFNWAVPCRKQCIVNL